MLTHSSMTMASKRANHLAGFVSLCKTSKDVALAKGALDVDFIPRISTTELDSITTPRIAEKEYTIF